jgi:hypothetical protein
VVLDNNPNPDHLTPETLSSGSLFFFLFWEFSLAHPLVLSIPNWPLSHSILFLIGMRTYAAFRAWGSQAQEFTPLWFLSDDRISTTAR